MGSLASIMPGMVYVSCIVRSCLIGHAVTVSSNAAMVGQDAAALLVYLLLPVADAHLRRVLKRQLL